MPVEIKDCDDAIGVIIETRGRMTDEELINAFDDHLTPGEKRFKQYQYILIDHSVLTPEKIPNKSLSC